MHIVLLATATTTVDHLLNFIWHPTIVTDISTYCRVFDVIVIVPCLCRLCSSKDISWPLYYAVSNLHSPMTIKLQPATAFFYTKNTMPQQHYSAVDSGMFYPVSLNNNLLVTTMLIQLSAADVVVSFVSTLLNNDQHCQQGHPTSTNFIVGHSIMNQPLAIIEPTTPSTTGPASTNNPAQSQRTHQTTAPPTQILQPSILTHPFCERALPLPKQQATPPTPSPSTSSKQF